MRPLPNSIAVLFLISNACTGQTSTPGSTPGPRMISADTVSDRELASGVRHLELHVPKEPWTIHLVTVDPYACGVSFRTVKGGDERVGREKTSAMVARIASRQEMPILAAINGDFFSFDPPGVSEGPQIRGEHVLKSEGGHREALESRQLGIQPAFGVTRDGRPFIARVTTTGTLEVTAGYTAPFLGINAPARAGSIHLYTPFFGDATPPDSGAFEIVTRGILHDVDSNTTQAIVVGVDNLPSGVLLSEETAVFAGRGQGALFLRAFAQPGDTIQWQVDLAGAPDHPAELIGGFPLLLQEGQREEDPIGDIRELFAERRHPRSAIGLHPDGTVFLVAVDGRHPGHSEGMTMEELTEFLEQLGLTEALNLDGGGSTTLVVEGSIANRPSDEEGERAVANALVVLGPAPGDCPARTRRLDGGPVH